MKIAKDVKPFLLPFSLFFLALILAVGAGYWVRPWVDQAVQPKFPILDRVLTILKEQGLKELPPQNKIEYGMIRGLLQAYAEPYSIFVEPVQTQLQSDELQGRFGGIGVRIERDNQNGLLVFPYPGSPAQKAGLRDGDRLIQVDNLVILPETNLDSVEAALRGPVGKAVHLIFERAPEYSNQTAVISRAEVALPSTSWNLAPQNPQIGIIRVSVIAATSTAEITTAVQDLKQRGATGFVLDLRNNGGGLLDSGVDIARLFLREGIVIRQQYRGKEAKDFSVEKPGPLADIPLVIWVNKNTASAAEIIAGSLQSQNRAQLIGVPTYGKDSIQLVFNLEDGSSLHVTAAHWWIPGFETSLQGVGLQPNQIVGDTPNNNSDFIQATSQILGSK